MTTYVSPTCTVWGYDFSSLVRADGVTSSGGAIKAEEIQSPGRNYADVREQGRQPKKYKIVAVSTDREAIETFLGEVNTAPPGSEFYPVDATRCGYIASAWAAIKSKKIVNGTNLYEVEAEITCLESWLNGPDQGIEMAWDEPLDVISDLLTNDGQERAPLSYLQLKSDVNLPYVENLSVRITPSSSLLEHDRELILCEKLMRGMEIELGWQGDCIQSWEANFAKSMLSLSYDVILSTSGGSITSEVLTLQNGDYFLLPFYGPLPVAGSDEAAYIDLVIDAITGDGAAACFALLPDLSYIYEVLHDDLVVGTNRIYIPGLESQTFVAIGIRATAIGSISISALRGTVKRHVSPGQIPFSDPGEDFKIRIEATAGNYLRFVQAFHNDRFWY